MRKLDFGRIVPPWNSKILKYYAYNFIIYKIVLCRLKLFTVVYSISIAMIKKNWIMLLVRKCFETLSWNKKKKIVQKSWWSQVECHNNNSSINWNWTSCYIQWILYNYIIKKFLNLFVLVVLFNPLHLPI